MPTDDLPPPWLTRQRLETGRRIRDARVWANLTQEGLAHAIGAERRAIVRIELGITDPPISRLFHIARALRIPPSDLLPDEPPQE